jgi:CPA2 family monovalent cation:H+ antiporter-2
MEAEVELIFNIALVFILGGICSIVMKRLKLPTIFGYLVAGMLLGPHIFPQVVVPEDTVSTFSTMGIILLMFTIGLELNLAGLKRIASYAMIVVGIEMSLMVVIGYILGTALGLDSAQALFLGVTISCASTAFSLSVIKGNKYFEGRLYQTVMGLHIMEDVGIVIILAISAPIMGIHASGSLVETLILVVVFIALTLVIGLTLLPRFMDWVEKHYSEETLFMVGLGLAFGLAFLSAFLGLSEAIGAFLAGIIVSQSVCSKSLCHKIEPMKELFMAIFFLSIGLQLDPALMLSGLPLALAIAAVFIVGKTLSVSVGCFAANFKIRSSFYIAMSMAALGEFTFVTAKIAFDGAIIDDALYSSVVGAAVITMVLLPTIFKSAPRIFDAVVSRMPKGVFTAFDRIENTRLEARKHMDHSAATRNIIKRQLLYVFIDFVIILAILITMNVLNSLDQVLNTSLIGNAVLASLILFVASLVMILPAIVHIVKRLRVISEALANELAEGRAPVDHRRGSAYRLFRNINSMVVFVVLMTMIYPLLPRVHGISMPIFEAMIGIGALFVALLAWDTIESVYGRVSTALSKGLSETETPEEGDKGQTH